MDKKSKRYKVGIVLSWILIAAILIGAMALVSYNGFIRHYRLTKLADYVYSVNCRKYYYGLTNKILESGVIDPGCSTVRNGSIVGRNLDWTYDDSCEFVITTPAENDRYATIGVASLTGITEADAFACRPSIYYYVLPFYTVDGINEKGLFACTNEVPSGDAGITTGTNPGTERLPNVTAVRYVLDYAASVDEAISLLSARDIYSYTIDGAPYEIHIMLADRDKTVVVEFIDNKMTVVEDQKIMTNYYLGLDGYTDFAEGIERYDILVENYDSAVDEESMMELMRSVNYTKLYDLTNDPAWYSELYGDYVNESGEVFTYRSNPEDFNDIIMKDMDLVLNRQRDGLTWQTCHTSVYNLDELTLNLSAQETTEVFSFDLEPLNEIETQRENNMESRTIIVPLEALSVIILLVVLYGMLFENKIIDKKSRSFTVMVLICIVSLFSDLGAWAFDGLAGREGTQAFCNYLAFIMPEIMSPCFMWYEYEYMKERKNISKMPAIAVSVFNLAVIIALTVFEFMGKLFYFVEGVYFTSDFYILNVIASVVNLTIILVTVFHGRRILGRHDTAAFATYGFIPLIVALYEFVNPQLELGFVAVALALFFVYIMLQSGKTNELKMRQEILEELCYVDQLTGLNNRRAYDEALEAGNNSIDTGVIFCDVNGLKYTNDNMGHKAGDALLTRFSELLKDNFDFESIYRISGDEFVLILKRISERNFDAEVQKLAQKCFDADDIASVGGCYGRGGALDSLIRNAEKEMYKSKAEFYARNPKLDRRKKTR